MSSINPNNIDGTYPIAGQDNDSQGFRDNFTNIKNNLTFAQSELEDLQTSAILKAPLGSVGQTSIDNDLNYAQLKKAQLIQSVETSSNVGVADSTETISWADGHYQRITLGDTDTILTFANWPTTNDYYAKFRLQISVTPDAIANARAITLPSTITNASANTIQGCVNRVLRFPAVGTYEFEFGTYDQGTTVVAHDLTRNYISTNYQYQVLSANAVVQSNVGISRVVLAPTYSISNGANVILPNTQVDGTVISISSNVAIPHLAVTPSWLSTKSPNGNISLSAGNKVEFLYSAANNVWFRVG